MYLTSFYIYPHVIVVRTNVPRALLTSDTSYSCRSLFENKISSNV